MSSHPLPMLCFAMQLSFLGEIRSPGAPPWARILSHRPHLSSFWTVLRRQKVHLLDLGLLFCLLFFNEFL